MTIKLLAWPIAALCVALSLPALASPGEPNERMPRERETAARGEARTTAIRETPQRENGILPAQKEPHDAGIGTGVRAPPASRVALSGLHVPPGWHNRVPIHIVPIHKAPGLRPVLPHHPHKK